MTASQANTTNDLPPKAPILATLARRTSQEMSIMLLRQQLHAANAAKEHLQEELDNAKTANQDQARQLNRMEELTKINQEIVQNLNAAMLHPGNIQTAAQPGTTTTNHPNATKTHQQLWQQVDLCGQVERLMALSQRLVQDKGQLQLEKRELGLQLAQNQSSTEQLTQQLDRLAIQLNQGDQEIFCLQQKLVECTRNDESQQRQIQTLEAALFHKESKDSATTVSTGDSNILWKALQETEARLVRALNDRDAILEEAAKSSVALVHCQQRLDELQDRLHAIHTTLRRHSSGLVAKNTTKGRAPGNKKTNKTTTAFKRTHSSKQQQRTLVFPRRTISNRTKAANAKTAKQATTATAKSATTTTRTAALLRFFQHPKANLNLAAEAAAVVTQPNTSCSTLPKNTSPLSSQVPAERHAVVLSE